jgi:hypothetical protein
MLPHQMREIDIFAKIDEKDDNRQTDNHEGNHVSLIESSEFYTDKQQHMLTMPRNINGHQCIFSDDETLFFPKRRAKLHETMTKEKVNKSTQ